ncbi:hypothetical protein NKI50_10895 [Mesorhizobium sp. M0563]|uniref:hypothetical protein n=1 Tax=Mesorhizobium sp. M0563 TaxID=2956959 RepID=UPI003338A39A
MFPLFYQDKGWTYHAYPSIFYAVAASLCLLALPRSERQSAGLLSRLAAPPRALVSLAIVAAFLPNWGTQKPGAVLVAVIRAATDRPNVALISPDIDTGHPLSRMIGGQFVSADPNDWLGAFAMALSRQATLSRDVAQATHYEMIMERYAESKRQEFERLRPDIIISTKVIRKDDGPWTSQLMERFGFDAILAHLSHSRRGRDRAHLSARRLCPAGRPATRTAYFGIVTRRSVRLMRPPFLSNAEVEG